jgi:pumilio RNA-binding family
VFLGEIKPQIRALIYDMYGNYVLLKCLETIDKTRMEFLVVPIEDSVQFMAQQTYGCRII